MDKVHNRLFFTEIEGLKKIPNVIWITRIVNKPQYLSTHILLHRRGHGDDYIGLESWVQGPTTKLTAFLCQSEWMEAKEPMNS